MGKRLLIFQHISWKSPGQYLVRAVEKNKAELTVVKLWKEEIPDLKKFDGLIVLGGPQNVNEEEKYPFLAEEKRAIRESIADDRPYLGICLGQQLLADALGAKVGPNYCASIGFVEGHLTHDGREHPVFKKLPGSIRLFKWHGQAVMEPVPKNIAILATSVECQVEAISVPGRPHILGVQFDNHAADFRAVETFWQKDQKWVSSFSGKYFNPAAMLADARKFQNKMAKEFEVFFTNFMALV